MSGQFSGDLIGNQDTYSPGFEAVDIGSAGFGGIQ